MNGCIVFRMKIGILVKIFRTNTISMIEYDSSHNPKKIIIPVSGVEEVQKYQKGILGILGKIEIDHCKPGFKEDLKAVYELLSHLLMSKELLLDEASSPVHRHKKRKVAIPRS
jgi:hypothetical protein